MSWRHRILGGTLTLLSLAGCHKLERTPKITDLHFPVVALFEHSGPLLCPEPAALKAMHTNYLTLNNTPPILIDSDFRIYSLDQFRSVHGGFWLMAHPSGVTEVIFELKPRKSGREAARELFGRQLQKQTWREDLESQQQALSRSQTLREMVQIVQSRSD